MSSMDRSMPRPSQKVLHACCLMAPSLNRAIPALVVASPILGSVSTETLLVFNGFSFILKGELSFHVLPQLELQLLPQVTYTFGEPRYVGSTDQPGEYLFGELAARSVGATLRTSYAFTNQLTLQLYAQLLLVAKHFSEFSSYQSNIGDSQPAIELEDLSPAPQPTMSPDIEEATLNTNAVLRWEFQPGSTLFLVYTRYQAPYLAIDGRAELNFQGLDNGQPRTPYGSRPRTGGTEPSVAIGNGGLEHRLPSSHRMTKAAGWRAVCVRRSQPVVVRPKNTADVWRWLPIRPGVRTTHSRPTRFASRSITVPNEAATCWLAACWACGTSW